MSDKTSRVPIEYLFTPEDLEKHFAELRKEEQEAKGLLQKMNLVALKALCVLYDNKVGDYPENEYEGESFWEYVKNLNTQVKKETKDGKKENKGNVLLIADFDEWYGPIYTCPFCDAEELWDDYKFCPCCGANLEGFRFETREEDEKRMKKENEKKDEREADLGLKQLGVAPMIYHFEVSVWPFRGITIANAQWSWGAVRRIIDYILADVIPRYAHERSTIMLQELRDRGLYGVSICEQRDQLNRQRGRTIAKGRLLKQLKQEEEK